MPASSPRTRLVALLAVFALLLGAGVLALTTMHGSSGRLAASRGGEASGGEEGESAEEREHERHNAAGEAGEGEIERDRRVARDAVVHEPHARH